jgi:2-polyprenyl-6-hydroxyphenyl methylase/3-demethylubiquinone-9 3-methyltransferase
MTTPHHGYLKNLLIALANRFDSHVTPLWEGGHIEFWPRRTLETLLRDAEFVDLCFRGAGRSPYLWRSIVVGATRR